MHARRLRQLLARARTIFQPIRDAEFGRDIYALGHLKALDQILQDELRREIVGGHVVPLLSFVHAYLDNENCIRHRQIEIRQVAGTH